MPGAAVLALRNHLTRRKSDAVQQFRQHLRPDTLLSALSRDVDQALRALIQIHPLPRGSVMAAVGGYGRGELYPHSDVDVLILLRQAPDDDDIAGIETLVAAMWDLGVEPGHSVRTINDCQVLASSDITVETSLSESRWLAGDQNLLSDLHITMRRQLDPRRYFQAKRAEMEERHARHQDTPYALEPNCKEAPGGLRDVQVLLWLARATGVGNTWGDIAATELITGSELRALRRSELAFKRLRIELHLLTGRREDRVLFDLQPALARVYGFEATRNRLPSELLMQRYYWAARVVSQMNVIIMQSIKERLWPARDKSSVDIDDDFVLMHGYLHIRRPDGFARNPTLLFRVFLVVGDDPCPPEFSAQTLRAMWHARRRIDAQFRRNPVNRRQFIQIFQLGRGMMPALRRLTMLNILPRYLPVFRRIVGQMQHDLFHAYTVDQHILMVIDNLAGYTSGDRHLDPALATQVASQFDGYWLLYIAALFHDIAKGRGGHHSELGAAEARRFCRQHGCSAPETELVDFLVKEHLTMSLVAQKRDLSDPEVIHAFARRVGSRRRLDALYVLTVADIRGTSPRLWNSWKGKLLEDLYQRTLPALSESEPDPDAAYAQRTESAARQIRMLGLSDKDRDLLWQQLDADYFMRHDADDIAWHTRHLYFRVNAFEPVVKVRLLGQSDALQIMVYTPDRDDLFVSICRYFDHRALSIQDARIHTTHHGWALDSFIVLVSGTDKDLVGHASLVENELCRSLQESPATAVDYGSEQGSRRPGSRRSRAFPISPEIILERDSDKARWKLSLNAADHPGLLHKLARVFASHRVSLKMAKILTLGDRVEDVFILGSENLEDAATRLQFEREISATLSNPNN